MSNKRALIVDDSTTAQYRLKKMLRSYDLHIDAVDSGEAALRYLSTNAPDVIFMDHLMPGMDGFRALQIIKSHPETATIPVIMYTSKSGDVYTGQARALGALDVVSKDTINAADLSKVMQAIHIYRDESAPTPKSESTDDQPEFIAAANGVSDVDIAPIEFRPPNPAGVEQSRSLELRLSHIEHTMEDSRRFITSRVVRELQGLRHNIKQELTEILASNNNAQPAPQPELVEEPPERTSASSGWAILSVILIAALLVIVIFYFGRMSDAINQAQTQQLALDAKLKTMLDQKSTEPLLTSSSVLAAQAAKADNNAGSVYLSDLAWAFNQSSALQFNQNNVDPKILIRLHEFLSRIINSGFKGTVLATIYVGNFCLSTDNLGQFQIPPDSASMTTCMLSSEVYGLDRVMKQYGNDIESVLNNLSPKQKKAITIVINSVIGPESYPERTPSVLVKDWNAVAQANNRLELRLDASANP